MSLFGAYLGIEIKYLKEIGVVQQYYTSQLQSKISS
jgi:hypothetical protein